MLGNEVPDYCLICGQPDYNIPDTIAIVKVEAWCTFVWNSLLLITIIVFTCLHGGGGGGGGGEHDILIAAGIHGGGG